MAPLSLLRLVQSARFWPALTLAACFVTSNLTAAERAQTVYVKSVISRAAPPTQGQTYALVEGTLQEGALLDASLASADMPRIAQTLTPGFQRAGLVAAADPTQADLLIVVHRGSLASDLALDKRSGAVTAEYAAAAALLRAPNADGGVSAARVQSLAPYAVAEMPGYTRPNTPLPNTGASSVETLDNQAALRDWGTDRDALFTQLDLVELRRLPIRDAYFTILMAYDLQKFRTQGQLERKWVTTLAVAGRQNNFRDALSCFADALAQSADASPGFAKVIVTTANAPDSEQDAAATTAAPILLLSSL